MPSNGAAVDVGLFGPDSVTWRVHADPSMLLGGFRSLLLQAVHPLVMAGFDANSVFRSDPWGRLRRTGEFIATTTYGTRAEAESAGSRLRRRHARLTGGVEPETGRAYRVDDPDLLRWVHCTEVESFLSTYRRSGGALAAGEGDQYVSEMRTAARLVGLDPDTVPATEADIQDYYRDVAPDLHVTDVARRNALWSLAPPMPAWVTLATPARPSWAGLIALSAALLPRWARRLYGLPGLVTTDAAATLAARALRHSLLLLPPALVDSPSRRAARERRRSERQGPGGGNATPDGPRIPARLNGAGQLD